MFFFEIPVADFPGVAPIATVVADNNGSTTNIAPTTINITDLPQEVFVAYPGLDNAVPNDNRDDADTIQAVLDWVANQPANVTLYIPEGVFDLAETLTVDRANITIKGAGTGRTVLQHTNSFKVGTRGLPDGETVFDSVNQEAYLFTLEPNADQVTLSNMTLTGPAIHGAVFSGRNQGLLLKNLEFNDFLWSAVRLFEVRDARIHDNVFVDAGGQADGDSGVTGGSIFATYLKDSEIYNNSISKSSDHDGNVYGIKGREFRNTRIYNNTIKTNFAIELPFENDHFVEIHHNYLNGVISVPKFGGGDVPEDGFSFHIHHNYFTQSYALEWARNGAKVNHNVFVFDPNKDNGNLISNFGTEPAKGPTKFYNNLIVNPGRGVVWHEGVYNNFSFYHNEVIANPTKTPRTEGLFGFNPKTDFSTIEIRDNLIRVNGASRPLMRNPESYGAVIKNNDLINIADVNDFENPDTGAPQGLLEPLSFRVGVNGEFQVDGVELKTATAATETPESTTEDGWSLLANWLQRVKQLFQV